MMELFRHQVFKMLLAEEKITATQVEKLLAWKHSGFSVYRGEKVDPEDKKGREHLASTILHPPMSQEKMTYDPETRTVHYRTKKQKGPEVIQTFSALDWLARLSTHIPDKWEPMVRYDGWYSNRPRGERKKAQRSPDEGVPVRPAQAESDFRKEVRQDWARRIKKVYEVDPLVCPNGSGRLRIISFIEEPAVIERILRHLGLWPAPARAPRAPPPAPTEITLDYSDPDPPASYD
ncbi:MAG: transposase [Acidobacteria bacterium]|nr:transposase [Acidobacteriota bacterium]